MILSEITYLGKILSDSQCCKKPSPLTKSPHVFSYIKVPIFSNLYTTPEHATVIDSLDSKPGHCIFNINIPYRFASSIVSFWLPATGMIIFYILVMRKAIQIESARNDMYNTIKCSDSDANYNTDNKRMQQQEKKIWRREYKVIGV